MGVWGSENSVYFDSLTNVLKEFPDKLRQAIYVAAQRNLIRRGTWDGCALNAAGKEVGEQVGSTFRASEVFGVNQSIASRFISIWDRREGTDAQCTADLKRAIRKSYLLPVEPHPGETRIVAKRVYTSETTQTREEFEAIVAANDFSDVELDSVLEFLNA